MEFIFVMIPILVVCIFIFTFCLLFSPKLRGKLMSRQIKSLKIMLDESKEDLKDLATTSGNVSIDVQKSIIDDNEKTLKDIANKKANINKDAIETTVRAIRKGITENTKYCKFCGVSIDEDSKFCKECGKEQ